MVHPSFDRDFINKALEESGRYWDFGNEQLYKMCRENPLHAEGGVVVAKVWLIGRAYAAAIERRIKIMIAKGTDFMNR